MRPAACLHPPASAPHPRLARPGGSGGLLEEELARAIRKVPSRAGVGRGSRTSILPCPHGKTDNLVRVPVEDRPERTGQSEDP